MSNTIYIIGLVVVVLAVLAFFRAAVTRVPQSVRHLPKQESRKYYSNPRTDDVI